jgi:hypothetical protein
MMFTAWRLRSHQISHEVLKQKTETTYAVNKGYVGRE